VSFVIEPCRLSHLREMNRAMREADRLEITGLGFCPRHVLFACWRESPYRMAATLDGEIAAVWGDAGSALDPVGQAWLFTAPPVMRLPVEFFRKTKEQVRGRLTMRHMLRSHVAEDYVAALRFFRLLGFTIAPPEMFRGVPMCEIRITR